MVHDLHDRVYHLGRGEVGVKAQDPLLDTLVRPDTLAIVGMGGDSGGRGSLNPVLIKNVNNFLLESRIIVPIVSLLVGSTLRELLELLLHPACGLPAPRGGVGEEVGDDGLGRILAVAVVNAVQRRHRIKVGLRTEVDVLPVSPDFSGDLAERPRGGLAGTEEVPAKLLLVIVCDSELRTERGLDLPHDTGDGHDTGVRDLLHEVVHHQREPVLVVLLVGGRAQEVPETLSRRFDGGPEVALGLTLALLLFVTVCACGLEDPVVAHSQAPISALIK